MHEIIKYDVSKVLNALIKTNALMPVFIGHIGMKSLGDSMRYVEAHAVKINALQYVWEHSRHMTLSINFQELSNIINKIDVWDELAVRDELRALIPTLATNMNALFFNKGLDQTELFLKQYKVPDCCTISFNEDGKAIIMAVNQ